MTVWLLTLDEAAKKKSTELLGGKIARLAWLREKGFAVPETWVLPGAAFRYCIKTLSPGLEPRSLLRASSTRLLYARAEQARAAYLGLQFPSELEKELRALYKQLASSAPWGLAVRSSASCEDGARISMAGLAETRLGVRSEEDLLRAVKEVWASTLNARALLYLAHHGVRDVGMAVAIQRVVPASASGVFFTRSPLPPYAKGFVANAVFGLPTAVVGGNVVPDVFQVDENGKATQSIAKKIESIEINAEGALVSVTSQTPMKPALSELQLAALRNVAKQLENSTHEPWDVEFAFEGEALWILQGRPITAAGYPDGGDASTVWSNANLGEALDGTMTPLTWSVASAFSERGFRQAFASLGCSVPKRTKLVALVHGRPYLNLSRFIEIASQVPWAPAEVLSELGGSMPGLEKLALATPPNRGKFLVKAPFVASRLIREQAGLGARLSAFDKLAQRAQQKHKALDLGILPDEGVARVFSSVQKLLDEAGTLMLTCAATSLGAHLVLRRAVRSVVGSKDAETITQLLAFGLDDLESKMPATFAARIARIASSDPAGAKALQAGLALRDFPLSPTRTALESFLDQHGDRAHQEAELSVLRWREDPSSFLVMVGASIGVGTQRVIDRNQRTEAGIRAFDMKAGRVRALGIRALAKPAKLAAIRREKMRAWVTRILGMLRDVALEADRRLTRLMPELAGDEEGVKNVFYLHADELVLTLKTARSDLAPAIRARRISHLRDAKRGALPLTFVGAPPLAVSAHPEGENVLKGLGASAGTAEGLVRVLTSPSDAFVAGEILVARATDIGWTPLFPLACAIVTELGGTLSHAAIIAREYGVPTVVGAAHAMRALQTGMRVRVDGTHGTVEILSASQAS
jgi:rifampicin phosphotransferase